MTNDSDEAFDQCRFELSGGYMTLDTAFDIGGRAQRVKVPYLRFRAGGTTMAESEGYARTLRGILIRCDDRSGKRWIIPTR